MSARFTIGLTGDVGSGKSTALAWLAERGASTRDADEIVHELLAGNEAVIGAVVRRFGPTVLAEARIDRAALAKVVFGAPGALADLERIVHPAVHEATRAWLDGVDGGVAAVEAVKLVEAGMAGAFDGLWLVVCDREERRRRLQDRGWSADEVARRLAAGGPLAPRLAAADVVIDNSGSHAATELQLEVAWCSVARGLAKGGA